MSRRPRSPRLVRHGARFLAREGLGPSAILSRIDRDLRERPGLSLCTALCLRLEGSRVVMSSAGHPSPLVVRGDGVVRELAGTGPLLGGWAESSWEEQTVELGPDDVLVLYTDGVTDARGESERFGLQRLRELLARGAAEHGSRAPRRARASARRLPSGGRLRRHGSRRLAPGGRA